MSTRFKLNTGAEIPAIGFGTWQDEGAQKDAVVEALKAGYRHIDTARVWVLEDKKWSEKKEEEEEDSIANATNEPGTEPKRP